MASSNLKHTTFTDSKKEVVTEMPVEPAVRFSLDMQGFLKRFLLCGEA